MHTAYYRTGPGQFREVFGLGFEQLRCGLRFAHRPGVTLTQQDNVEEALDSVNAAMVHYDEPYAGCTAFRKPLMVSTITVQRLIGMASKTFGLARRRIVTMQEISMRKPVFGGDTLYAESEVLELGEEDPQGGLVRLRTVGINQRGEQVATLDYTFRMARSHAVPLLAGLADAAVLEPRFASHAQRADGAWVEQTGLFFEDLRADETFLHYPGRRVRADEAATHALRSLEITPDYHVDAESAVPQAWILTIAAALSTRTLGRVTANLAWKDVAFLADVKAGDVLHGRSTIVATRESSSRPSEGVVTVRTTASNQRDEPVVRYERTLLVYRRGAPDAPYEQAGY